jgi:hypothetical protein
VRSPSEEYWGGGKMQAWGWCDPGQARERELCTGREVKGIPVARRWKTERAPHLGRVRKRRSDGGGVVLGSRMGGTGMGPQRTIAPDSLAWFFLIFFLDI